MDPAPFIRHVLLRPLFHTKTVSKRMKKALQNLAIAAGAALLATGIAFASAAEITWDDQGVFEYAAELESEGVVEVCGPLKAGDQATWAFNATDELDFNIHYHEGEEVVYPVQSKATSSLANKLVAPVDQTYCWMWTSQESASLRLKLRLSRAD